MIVHGKTNWIFAFTLITVLVLSGCAAFAPPPPFPTDPNAEQHYDAGERLLEAQRYELAAGEYEQSLEYESGAYVTHAKLAVAYFGQQKFVEAARQFEASYELWGGPSSGSAWAIMQAASLQRAGDRIEAETLLRSWTGSGVVVTAVGSYTSGQPLKGDWKLFANYLQGSIDEASVLEQVTPDNMPMAYLVLGISNSANGVPETAGKFVEMAEDAITNQRGWTIALSGARTSKM